MDEEQALTICEEKGYLNEIGLMELLKYARKEIIKYEKRIEEENLTKQNSPKWRER